MRINNLITRTGLARGVMLTGSGDPMTDTPGAGNDMVGSFYLDFSAVLPHPDDGTLLPDISRIDNEFTAVIADGRYLENENSNGDDDFLLDEEDTPEDMDGAMVDDATRMLTVDSVRIDWRFIGPSFEDSTVWDTDSEGEVVNVLDTLDNYLDARSSSIIEAAGEGDTWTVWGAHLRWTLHWALIVVDCTNVNDEGRSDFVSENSGTSIVTAPVPVAGPRGLLLTYGAPSGDIGTFGGVRLWSPHEGSQGLRFVARGEREYPYHYRVPNDRAVPNAQYETDPNTDTGIDIDMVYGEEDASSRVEGRNIHLRVNLRRKVKLRDDQMLVFTAQTGRARIGFYNLEGDKKQALIAGPAFLDGRNGPVLRMYHHATRATGTSR